MDILLENIDKLQEYLIEYINMSDIYWSYEKYTPSDVLEKYKKKRKQYDEYLNKFIIDINSYDLNNNLKVEELIDANFKLSLKKINDIKYYIESLIE